MAERNQAQEKSIRRLWLVFGATLSATVLAEFWFPNEPHFEIERLFGYSTLYGFLSCTAMILAAKALGVLLKRPESYYHERGDE